MGLFQPLSFQKYSCVDAFDRHKRAEPIGDAGGTHESIIEQLATNVVGCWSRLRAGDSETEMEETNNEQTETDLVSATHAEQVLADAILQTFSTTKSKECENIIR